MGLVGELVGCNVDSLIKILENSIPVVSPIAFNIGFLDIEQDGILNVNDIMKILNYILKRNKY